MDPKAPQTLVGKVCKETLFAEPAPTPTQSLAMGMALMWLPVMERLNGVDRELGIRRRWKEFDGVFNTIMKDLDTELRSVAKGPGEILPLPAVDPDDMTPEAVVEYMRWPIPLVVRGWASRTEACQKWSPSYFKEHYGNVPIRSFKSNDDLVEMPMRETIERMETDKSLYINNVSNLMNAHPELEAALDLDRFKKALGLRGFYGMQLFVGPEGRGTSLHAGASLNVFINIHGSKEWTLINPRHGLWTLPNHQRQGHHSESSKSAAEVGELCRYIPVYRVALQPGDVLLNPTWWWHQIRNLEGISIACSSRVADHTFGELNPTMFHEVAQHTSPFQEQYIRELAARDFAPQRMTDENFLSTYDNLRTQIS